MEFFKKIFNKDKEIDIDNDSYYRGANKGLSSQLENLEIELKGITEKYISLLEEKANGFDKYIYYHDLYAESHNIVKEQKKEIIELKNELKELKEKKGSSKKKEVKNKNGK